MGEGDIKWIKESLERIENQLSARLDRAEEKLDALDRRQVYAVGALGALLFLVTLFREPINRIFGG